MRFSALRHRRWLWEWLLSLVARRCRRRRCRRSARAFYRLCFSQNNGFTVPDAQSRLYGAATFGLLLVRAAGSTIRPTIRGGAVKQTSCCRAANAGLKVGAVTTGAALMSHARALSCERSSSSKQDLGSTSARITTALSQWLLLHLETVRVGGNPFIPRLTVRCFSAFQSKARMQWRSVL